MVVYAISRSIEGKRTFDEKGGFCKKMPFLSEDFGMLMQKT